MTDRVWDHAPPEAARTLLQTYVARLRRAFATGGVHQHAVTITYRSGGYEFTIDPELVDLHRFRHILGQSTSLTTVDRMRQALSLWRGALLSGLDGEWAQRMRVVLDEQRLAAQQQLIDAQLRAGSTTELLGLLDELLAAHPLDEKLIGQQMLALHLAGRQAEALGRYREARTRLLNELGDEPGPELQELHQRLLRRDSTLRLPVPRREQDDVQPADAAREDTPLPVQRQLPAHTPHFVGRAEVLRNLTGLADAVAPVDGTVRIVTVIGTAGIGKTTLAVHWAHQVADRFPDGQLYVNLRGFDRAGPPMRPDEAIRGFLDAFEIPPDRIPRTVDGQAGLYRSLLAGRRVLIVVDNACDADQVRPLLPGSPGCLVVITGRGQFAGLIASEGARTIALDGLSHHEARTLLARQLGERRVAAEPDAVTELIGYCAGLPIALAIMATRAATNPDFPLSALARELRDERTRLDALDAGDSSTSVRAAFSLSYEYLSPRAATLFRLLGLHHGPDISLAAAASLAGEPLRRTREALAELTLARLLSQHAPGRYALQNLLRTYASDLAQSIDPAPEREAAIRRVLDHYLHSAVTVARLLDPAQEPITVDPPSPGAHPEKFDEYGEAWAWCTAERAVLLAAVRQADDGGFDSHAWQLPSALGTYFQRGGHWHDWIGTQNIALAAARRAGSCDGQARAHRSLGHAGSMLGSHQIAYSHLRSAIRLTTEVGDRTGQAHARRILAGVLQQQGRRAEALDQANQALSLYQAADDKVGQANGYNVVGWYHAQLGNHHDALAYCRHALDLHSGLDDPYGEATTLGSLGYAHHHLGHHHQAVAHFERAVDLHRELNDRYYQADVLTHLAEAHHAAGDADAARETLGEALATLDDLGHPAADQVRRKLSTLEDS